MSGSASDPDSRGRMLWRAALLLSLLLAACGGGDSTLIAQPGGVGSGGTGISLGTVSGFGSVIVNGDRLDDSLAALEVESEPGNPNKAGIDATQLKLGQQVEMDYPRGSTTLSKIAVQAQLIGSVAQVDAAAGRLVVLGQEVRTNANSLSGPVSLFDAYESLASVSVGDRVEIHGLPRSDASTGIPVLQATRIEHLSDRASFVRVSADITELNSARNQFRLGTLTVQLAAGARLLPAGVTLADGQRVAVWSATGPASGVLTATALRVIQRSYPGREVRVGGVVDACSNSANCAADFSLSGVPVSAGSASFVGGSAKQLGIGANVTVIGEFSATASRLNASTVTLRSAADADVTLYGSVVNLVGTNTFSLRGLPVSADSATAISAGCRLAEGAVIKLEGNIAGNVIKAANVQCQSSPAGLLLQFKGFITGTSASAASATFRLDSQPQLAIQAVSGTVFSGNTPTGLASIVNGRYAEVEGRVSGDVLTASQIKFTDAPTAGLMTTSGKIDGVSASQFRINGLTIVINSSTPAPPPGLLVNGQNVRVEFLQVGNQLVAQRIAPAG